MPLTEMPNIEKNFRNTSTITYETRSMNKAIPIYTPTICFQNYCGITSDMFRESIALTLTENIDYFIDRQFSLISLSLHMFKNARELNADELEVMNRTSSRMFSKTPTSL